MAIYRHLGSGASSRATWTSVDFIAVVGVSSDEVVILNSDGTETRLYSASGDFAAGAGGLSGTVTSAARTDDAGAIACESVDGLSISVADLMAAGGQLFQVLIEGAATIGLRDALFVGADPWAPSGAAGAMAGFALADFAYSSGGVMAYLDGSRPLAAAPNAIVADAAFVGMAGSAAGDTFYGNASANVIIGAAGDDTLSGGAGADTLIGGEGSDWVDYATADAGVTVSLADPSQNTGDAAGDVYSSVENVAGSAYSDTIIGDSAGNIIAAGQGDDSITLGGGDDTLVFHIGDGVDVITDFGAAGFDRITLVGYGSGTSFAMLLEEQRIVTGGGVTEVLLGGGDRLILAGLDKPPMLSAAQFGFAA